MNQGKNLISGDKKSPDITSRPLIDQGFRGLNSIFYSMGWVPA